jgi:hypothetical protein
MIRDSFPNFAVGSSNLIDVHRAILRRKDISAEFGQNFFIVFAFFPGVHRRRFPGLALRQVCTNFATKLLYSLPRYFHGLKGEAIEVINVNRKESPAAEIYP